MMSDEFEYCTNEQKNTCIIISNFYSKLKQPYLGAIYALKQTDNPDRLVHFAHSLREVIDLLAKKDKYDGNNYCRGTKKRKRCLMESTDILRHDTMSHSSDCSDLAGEYDKLSNIAHHGVIENETELISKLEHISKKLSKLLQPQTSLFDDIDEIINNSVPSLENAQKIKDLIFNRSSFKHVFDNMSEDWLPFMKEIGLFNNPRGEY